MRAAVVERYGDPEVVRVVEVPQPEPRSGEVLVRVHATPVTSGDARIRAARFPDGFAIPARLAFGLRGPRRPILGGVFSGEIAAVGADVTGWAVGERVAGMNGVRMGAHADHVRVSARRLARVPAAVSHDDAAGVLFGGTAALHFLRDRAGTGQGSTVLVNGASGAIGTNAVQLAARWGASVTAVTSAGNAPLALRLGAQRVVDYRSTPIGGLAERFDVVLDAVGNISIGDGRRLLNPGGRLLLAVASLGSTLRARGNVSAGPAPERAAHFEFLLGMVASGELVVVHDSAFDLTDIVEAHRRVDTGHKIGNVIVRPVPLG